MVVGLYYIKCNDELHPFGLCVIRASSRVCQLQCSAIFIRRIPQIYGSQWHKTLHGRSPPSAVRSNGLAKYVVQSVKSDVLKMEGKPGSLQTKILQFLPNYRNTPHSVTAQSPAMMLLVRLLKTRYDLLQPPSKSRRIDEIAAKFQPGDEVLAQNYQKVQPTTTNGNQKGGAADCFLSLFGAFRNHPSEKTCGSTFDKKDVFLGYTGDY